MIKDKIDEYLDSFKKRQDHLAGIFKDGYSASEDDVTASDDVAYIKGTLTYIVDDGEVSYLVVDDSSCHRLEPFFELSDECVNLGVDTHQAVPVPGPGTSELERISESILIRLIPAKAGYDFKFIESGDIQKLIDSGLVSRLQAYLDDLIQYAAGYTEHTICSVLPKLNAQLQEQADELGVSFETIASHEGTLKLFTKIINELIVEAASKYVDVVDGAYEKLVTEALGKHEVLDDVLGYGVMSNSDASDMQIDSVDENWEKIDLFRDWQDGDVETSLALLMSVAIEKNLEYVSEVMEGKLANSIIQTTRMLTETADSIDMETSDLARSSFMRVAFTRNMNARMAGASEEAMSRYEEESFDEEEEMSISDAANEAEIGEGIELGAIKDIVPNSTEDDGDVSEELPELTGLWHAVDENDTEKAIALIKDGAPVNAVIDVNSEIRDMSPLMFAAEHCDNKLVLALIDAGADINAKASIGYVPLTWALKGDNLGNFNAILSAGADPDPLESREGGYSPLSMAAKHGLEDAVKVLLAHKVNINWENDVGRSALKEAVMGRHGGCVKLLLDGGADPSKADDEGFSPIHNAARNGDVDILKMLIDAGADVNAPLLSPAEDEGETAINVACYAGHFEVVKTLVNHGAQLNDGGDVLHDAISGAYNRSENPTEMVQYLIDNGTKVCLKTYLLAVKIAPVQTFSILLTHLTSKAEEIQEDWLNMANKFIAETLLDEENEERRSEIVNLLNAAGDVCVHDDQGALNIENASEIGAIPVFIGVYCHDLRYDEEGLSRRLPDQFTLAKEAWIASLNDPKSPQYQQACDLITPFFECNFKTAFSIHASLDLDEDNRVSGVRDVETDTSGLAVSSVFSEAPKLKTVQVVSVDYRRTPSVHTLRNNERLLTCPEVGLVAVFEAKISDRFDSSEEFSRWLSTDGTALNESFSFEMVGSALEVTEVDEDGCEITSSQSSWSGGDALVEAWTGDSVQPFVRHLSDKVWNARETPSLLGESVPELRRILMLADAKALREALDAGLDVDSTVEDEPILKMALMLAVTAENWFTGAETGDELSKRFKSLPVYRAELKRIIIELLDRGASVNAGDGFHSIIGIASALGDPEILERCMQDADSADDVNATAFLVAAERGDVQMMKALLAKGARINKRQLLYGTTALMLACQGPGGEDEPPLVGDELKRQEKAVAFLIENGAEIDAVSNDGDTAIGNAVKRGNVTIVKMLLDQSAKVTEALPAGQPLIDAARERGYEDIVRLLGKSGLLAADGERPSREEAPAAKVEAPSMNYMPEQADLDLDVDTRYVSLSDNQFDDRWNRLIDIQNKISESFVDELAEYQDQLTQKEYDTLMSYVRMMQDQNHHINETITTATNKDLGRYAKSIKNAALITLGLCQEYRVFNDVDTYGYDASKQMIQINGEDFYYLGQ